LTEKSLFLNLAFEEELQEAPALPLPENVQAKPKTKMEEMEDFLDDLLG